MDETDLRILVDIILRITGDANVRLYGNTQFPCDSEIEGGFVVCTDDPLPIEAGDIYPYVMKVGAEIPAANPDRFYTYSVVVDADGDPGNNFQFNPPYDWDYFQNTDRWYTFNWNPDLGLWTLDIYDIAQNLYVAPSAARTVVMGDIITFLSLQQSFLLISSPTGCRLLVMTEATVQKLPAEMSQELTQLNR